MLDRFDIQIEVPRVDYEKLSQTRLGESSNTILDRVETARKIQHARYSNQENSDNGENNHRMITCNTDMGPGEIRKFCQLDKDSEKLIRAAMRQMQLSARAYHRILKLSRTIADLAGNETILTNHLAEALQYRPKLMLDT